MKKKGPLIPGQEKEAAKNAKPAPQPQGQSLEMGLFRMGEIARGISGSVNSMVDFATALYNEVVLRDQRIRELEAELEKKKGSPK